MIYLLLCLFFEAFALNPAVKEYASIEHKNVGVTGIPLSHADRTKLLLHFGSLIYQAHESDEFRQLKEKSKELGERLADDPTIGQILKSKILTWDEFRKEYEHTDSLPFIGYGSLINKKSAMGTLQDERPIEPIIAFGGKRIFKLPRYNINAYTQGLPSIGYEHEVACLGVELTADAAHCFNGVVFDLRKEELDAMQQREGIYQIKWVPYIKIADLMGDKLSVDYAYVLVYQPHHNSAMRPHLNYLHLVLEGHERAYLAGYFLETTYLADGETTLTEWIGQEINEFSLQEAF
jgi:hypothetical protein